MRRREGFLPLSEFAVPSLGRLFPEDPGPFLNALLHLDPGTLDVEIRGEEVLLRTQDRSVRLAVEGLEGELLRRLKAAGYDRLRRISWRSR